MSFTIKFADGVRPNHRSQLSEGLRLSKHPKSSFKPMDIPSEPLAKLSRTLEKSALATDQNPSEFSDQLHPEHRSVLPELEHQLSLTHLNPGSRSRSRGQNHVRDIFQGENEKNTDELTLEPTARSTIRIPAIEASQPTHGDTLAQGLVVTILEYLHGGHLWDFWSAEHPQHGPVVFKVVYTPLYPCRNPNLDDYVPYRELLAEALREEQFYIGQLKNLQGKVVPKYLGLYTSDKNDTYLAIMLENAGRSMGSGFLILHEDWLLKVYETFQKVHLQGVEHNDIDGRHVIVRDGELRLVGFRRSLSRDLTNPFDVRKLLQEASDIRGRFGHATGAELSLPQASPEYWVQLPDPVAFKASIDAGAAKMGWVPPEIRAINMKRGARYTEDGFEIKRSRARRT